MVNLEIDCIILNLGDVYYRHENKVCSNSLDEIYEYCKKTYTMSENEMSELMKYKSVDDIYNQYRLPINLIIDTVQEI